ncbi:hypothetical protein HU200_021798 [Digitaria exilis]|uniref:Uncharacterized protein n=1 Tax=Digitaria exilis TaxID=1010633 RepID=A0A835EYV9_9POAL|nr:hypothetical protein HU200_021798 [Digitaria exilis]
MRNNRIMQSLGVTALSSILNNSLAKRKVAAREESSSEYQLEDMEDIEHGVVDKVPQNSPHDSLTRNTIMPARGTSSSKRVMPPAEQDQITRMTMQKVREQDQTTRMTRQMTRELSSVEEGLQEDELNPTNSPMQADQQIQMCNEGKKALLLSPRLLAYTFTSKCL